MEGSFGARLRSQREQQQVPLADIAERTKIKVSLLEALERDDVSQWPTGIFRRSFVRAYAQAIGLDGDAVLREFLDLYPDPVEEDVAAALVTARESRRPPTRLGCLISSAIGAWPARRKATAPEPVAPNVTGDHADGSERDRGNRPESLPPGETLEFGPAPADHPLEIAADQEPVFFEDDGGDPRALEDWNPAVMVPTNEESSDDDASHVIHALSHEQQWPQAGASGAGMGDLGHSRSARAAGSDAAPDYGAVAELCTRLARALQPRDVMPVLEDAARLLDAVGLIVWMWDPATRTLAHVLAHGYSHQMLSRLPRVRWDSDNAIAEAFRSADTRVVAGSGTSTGAVVVPIVTGAGCAGVLAMEVQARREEREWVRAVGAILAAQLAALFGFDALAEAVGA